MRRRWLRFGMTVDQVGGRDDQIAVERERWTVCEIARQAIEEVDSAVAPERIGHAEVRGARVERLGV